MERGVALMDGKGVRKRESGEGKAEGGRGAN